MEIKVKATVPGHGTRQTYSCSEAKQKIQNRKLFKLFLYTSLEI